MRRKLTREVAALEANLDALLASEVLAPERYAHMEAQITAKRTELVEPDREPEPQLGRHLDAQQFATVRQLLDNLEARWPTLRGGVKNELLRFFLERIEVRAGGALVTLRLRWVMGQEQTIEIERPHYRPKAEERWTSAEEVVLRKHFPSMPVAELCHFLPGRTARGVRKRAAEMGLRRTVREVYRGGAGRHFSAEQDALVRR